MMLAVGLKKSSAAPAANGGGSQMVITPLLKGKHDKKCSENPPFEIPDGLVVVGTYYLYERPLFSLRTRPSVHLTSLSVVG